MCPKDKLDLIRKANNKLTEETGLVIEEAFYNKMIIKDVNNYVAEYSDSTKEHEHIKLKGCFEIDKEFHKDPSMRIVPIALKDYFLYNIPIKQTIENHKDIFDFCMRLKINSSSTACWQYFDETEHEIKKVPLDRTTRYYVSNKGGILLKKFGSGSTSGVNVGFNTTLFNTYIEKDDYDINYKFYISEANKVKDAVVDKQLYLFDI